MDQILDSSGYSNADSISDLPGDIIDEILKHLPLRDAVRTSILSKEWRYRWVTIPYLDFSSAYKESWLPIQDPNFLKIYILRLYKGPLVKLSINMCNFGRNCRVMLNRLLNLLSNRNAESLTLTISQFSHTYMLPSHVLNLDHLTNLNLTNVHVKLTRGYRGLRSLVTLDIVDVYIETEDFRKLISKCPMLKFLSVCNDDSMIYPAIDFDAPPTLNSFTYIGIVDQIFWFEGANIDDISIIGEPIMAMPMSHGKDTSLIKFFGQLPSIQKLELCYSFVELLAKNGVPRKLPKNLNFLTLIQFDTFNLANVDCVASLLCLVRSSPNLCRLEIQYLIQEAAEDADVGAMDYLKGEVESEGPISVSLREVIINTFVGCAAQMEFVKLVLLKAKALTYLEIKFSKTYIDLELKQALESLCEATYYIRFNIPQVVIHPRIYILIQPCM